MSFILSLLFSVLITTLFIKRNSSDEYQQIATAVPVVFLVGTIAILSFVAAYGSLQFYYTINP